MGYPKHIPLDSVVLNGRFDNISGSSSSIYIPVIAEAVVTDVWAAIANAITVANATLTVKVIPGGTGTAVTLGTITIVQSGSAAGNSFEIAFTGTVDKFAVHAGDVIEIDTDGGSTTACVAWLSVVLNNN